MIKIMKELWNKHEKELRERLAKRTDVHQLEYVDLVHLTFQTIFNGDDREVKLNLKEMTEIDNGDYQGTMLYLIPFKTYQPAEYEYLMTYVWYGSCSGCDALQAAKFWCDDGPLTGKELKAVMAICKDIVCNTIKPYNCGWRGNDEYKPVEES